MKYVISSILFLSFVAFSNENLEAQKDQKIIELLKKEIKMVENVQNKKIELSYRLLELYSEELAFIKKQENSKFLKSNNPNQKDTFFKNSVQRYTEVKNYGFSLLEQFKNTKYAADIYYTLALNSRDFGKDNKTEEYLQKALSLTRDKDVKYNASTALADFYYNEKEYQKAISLYEFLTKNSKDSWMSKNTFNLAWCYLKIKKNELALNTMLESYYLSQDKAFINITDQALDHLPLFYSVNNKLEEGFEFFTNNTTESSRYLLKMARRASENGDYAGGLYLINKSKELYNSKNQFTQIADIHSFELDYYTTFKQWQKHEIAASDLVKLNEKKVLTTDLISEVVEKLKTHASFLQKKITRNAIAGFENFEGNIPNTTIIYFDFLSKLDESKKYLYRYYQAETMFSAKRYNESVPYYKESINFAKSSPSKEVIEFAEKSLDSLLYIIGDTKSVNNSQELTYYTFNSFVEIFPKLKKTQDIYPRLVNLNLKDKKFDEARSVLVKYVSNFPEDIKPQQDLYLAQINLHIENRDPSRLAFEINEMKKGFLKIKTEYIKDTEITLGNILFKDYLVKEESGQTDEAIKGYLQLFNTEYYPQSIRARSAYNLSFSYNKINKNDDSFNWLVKAYSLFTAQEILENTSNAQALSEYYFLKQDFKNALKANEFLISAIPQGKLIDLKEKIYKSIIQLSIFSNNYDNAFKFSNLGENFKIDQKIIENMKDLISDHLLTFKKDNELSHFSIYNKNNPNIIGKYKKSLSNGYWLAFWENNQTQKNIISNRVEQLKQLGISTDELDHNLKCVSKIENVQKLVNNFTDSKIYSYEQFDEEKFNNSLTSYLSKLASVKKELDENLKENNPHSVLVTFNLLEKTFAKAAFELSNLNFNFEDQNYKNSFDQQISQISKKIFAESLKYQKQLNTITSKSIVFSPYAKFSYNNKDFNFQLNSQDISRDLATIDIK